MPKLLRGMLDNLNVTVGDHTSQTMPETLTSQTRMIIWSVSNMPTVPATEEATVDCVAFFCEEGKGGKNFQKKNTFRCKVKREERSLQKLKDTKRCEGFRQVHDIHKYFDKISDLV